MQEFTLRWSDRARDLPKEIVRKRCHFHPHGASEEVEDYTVDLSDVTVLEISILLDLQNDAAYAKVAKVRVV